MEPITIQVIKTKDRVKKLLETYPAYRDNDERLTANVWNDQLTEYSKRFGEGYLPANLSAYDFFKLYAKGDVFTSADLITRARAKLEEQVPELRGKSYEERHRTGKIVSSEINHI